MAALTRAVLWFFTRSKGYRRVTMARTTNPVCKMCRREGRKLYLKGARCESDKCSVMRRNKSPGMHADKRTKLSEYGTRLREKQKLKRFYGLLDRQVLRNFDLASRTRGNTGEQLLSLMERRMDNVVYRMGWAGSRAAARQLVVHGHFSLNGKHVDIPSLLVKPGDVVSVKSRERSLSLVRKLAEVVGRKDAPPYLEAQGSESDPLQCRMTRLPSRTDVDPRLEDQGPLREQLIIEFCSR